MIHIIITSYKEPKATLRAVKAFLNQKISEDFMIIVVDPFEETKEFLKQNLKDKRVGFFLDPGEGKSHAINLLLKQIYSDNTNDILIFTDGDVYVSGNAVQDLLNRFKDKTIGCVTGKPVSLAERGTKYGYWSKLLYAGVDRARKRMAKGKEFFQVTGYLFAIRNGIFKEIPIDVADDAIMPFYAWQKGCKIDYAEQAEVYVKYPDNWKDWVNQRVRTIKGHKNTSKLYPGMPEKHSLFRELKEGALFAVTFPKSFMEFIWTIELAFARFYIYYKSAREQKKSETAYDPGWRDVEIESAKPLD